MRIGNIMGQQIHITDNYFSLQWMRYLSDYLPIDANPTPTFVAQLVFRYAQIPECIPVKLEILRQAFCISETTISGDHITAGEGILYSEKSDPEQTVIDQSWKPNPMKIAIGNSSPTRRRAIEMHEICHVILLSLLQHHKVSIAFKEKYSSTAASEQYCNLLANSLLLPKSIRNSWTAKYILANRNRISIDHEEQVTLADSCLSFSDIVLLAKENKVSLRLTVQSLHHHPVLDEMQTGIAILRVAPNRYTGMQSGLRVWQSACPTWGYIILNQRATKQGFLYALTAYEQLQSGRSCLSQETITLNNCMHPNKVNNSRKWSAVDLHTTCAYTAVDVKSEDRFLFVFWHWPSPAQLSF